MKIAAGRNFSREFLTDSDAIVINESAARMMGFPNPIGQRIYELESIKTGKVKARPIIGVIKNFNFNSLREVVTPLMLVLEEDRGSLALRVHGGNIPQLVSKVEDEWKKIALGKPFSYSFMDEDFNAIYKAEQRMGGISLSFSLLAIFIACLGLFGLAAYAAEQRTREIGIRKVLGASVGGIMSLLSRDFLVLVIVSTLIAFPFAWWAMHHWLQGFAYRIDIGWEVFALAAVLSIGIALLTVSFQAVRAAIANPVKSLRSE
jgi:putative ABC transport system permease protein